MVVDPPKTRFLPVTFLLLSVLGAAGVLYYHLFLFMPRVREVSATHHLAGPYSFGNDFYPIWLTARERPRDLYSPNVTREIQLGLFGRPLDQQRSTTDPLPDYRTYAYPAFTNLLFWYTAVAPFPILRILLAIAFGVLTILSVLLWVTALEWKPGPAWMGVVLVLTLTSFPGIEGMYAAQLGLLVGFLLAAGLLAITRERYFLAGVLLGLTLIKPQMIALEIGFLALWTLSDWHRRKLFLVGLLSTAAVLVASALVVWPHWIGSWLHVLFSYHRYAKPPLLKEVLAKPFGPAADPIGLVLVVAALAVSLVLVWRRRRTAPNSFEFWMTSALLLGITTVALLPGQAVHDHVILLPGIFLLAKYKDDLTTTWVSRLVVILGLAVFLWPWIAGTALVALRPILSDQVFYSKAVFVLPLRTAGVFPFVVLALLALVYRSQTESSGSASEKAALTMQSA